MRGLIYIEVDTISCKYRCHLPEPPKDLATASLQYSHLSLEVKALAASRSELEVALIRCRIPSVLSEEVLWALGSILPWPEDLSFWEKWCNLNLKKAKPGLDKVQGPW